MASLLVVEGVGQGRLMRLTEPLVSIGRDDTCTFQILDPLISRKHLQIRLDPALSKHFAADYRSAHGVVINGKAINLDVALNEGDRITIGSTTLVYLEGDHADAASAAAAVKKTDEWKRSTLIDRP
jgi:pSer/pThr/pTyr-binding forkhead associated (FHA) protein